jgi:hypothetical protein
MHLSDVDGQLAYELEEFCKDFGHPRGRAFYADVVGTVCDGKVIFDLCSEDLVCTRKAH